MSGSTPTSGMTMTSVPTAAVFAPLVLDLRNTSENSSMLSCLSPSESNSTKNASSAARESSLMAPEHRPNRNANASSLLSAKISSGLDTRPS